MLRTLIVVLLVIVALPFVAFVSNGPPPSSGKSDGNSPKAETRGQQQETQDSHNSPNPPVQPGSGPQSQVNAQETAKENQEQATANRRIFAATCALVIATLILAGGTFWQVCVTRHSAQRQLRAYLCIETWSGVYQEEDKNLKFEVRPLLKNVGQTPARKVCYVAKAEVLPFPLPATRDLGALPERSETAGEGYLGRDQGVVLSASVDSFYSPAEAEAIKRGKDKSLYIWGKATYVDVFGKPHWMKFCHNIIWKLDAKGNEAITGCYAGGNKNDAD